MIGALGLGMIGTGIIFIWAGMKNRKVGEFFGKVGPVAAGGTSANPVPMTAEQEANLTAGGGGEFAPKVAPVLPAAGVPR